jgi:hypothetical protein
MREWYREYFGKGKVQRLGRESFRVGIISIVIAEVHPKRPRHFT